MTSIPEWTPPWPTTDRPSVIRITPTHLADDPRWTCPEQVAAKARPGVRPQRERRDAIAYSPYANVPIGLARAALYRVLCHGESPDAAIAAAVSDERGEVAQATTTALHAAVRGYLAAVAALREAAAMPTETVVREFFTRDEPPREPPVEWWGWGLLHISRDSLTREFHLLRWRDAGLRPRSAAALALYARVAADAIRRPDAAMWFEPFPVDPGQPRAGSRVVIREIGLIDGSSALLADLTVEEAREWFAREVPAALGVLAGGSHRPGSHCADCAIRPECSGLARLPGVLGVAGSSAWTRRFTPGDLAVAETCSWRLHLTRDLGLPRVEPARSPALDRGTSIHEWLEQAHGRLQGCTAADLPIDSPGEVGELLGWDADRYRSLRPYLLQHLAHCPLRHPEVVAAYPEQAMTAWDTDADVIVSTRPDLVVEFPDHVVVRETKTVSGVLADRLPEEHDVVALLQAYPQAAVTVCMLADGLDPITGEVGAVPVPARVEVEFLAPDEGRVVSIEVRDAEAVLAARRILADGVDRIIYGEPVPHLGPWCRSCPVAAWCSAATARDSIDADEAVEVVDGSDQAARTAGGRVALLSWVDTVEDRDDDIPF